MIKSRISRDKRYRLTPEKMRFIADKCKDRIGLEIKLLAELTTTTWNHKPAFVVEKGPRSAIVTTDDMPWHYLNEGTRVRRAVMSKDFIAKTQPGNIVSGSGAGGVVFISRKIALPGIKARHFDKSIRDELKPQLKAIWRETYDLWRDSA